MIYDLGQGLAPHLSIGRVMEVNPNTYTAHVRVSAGRASGSVPECLLRCLGHNNGSRTGIVFLPDVGDEVFIDWSYGPTPVITDYTPQLTSEETRKEPTSQILPVRTFGGEDKHLRAGGNKPYRYGPRDLMPGDKVIQGKLGNLIGVLAGGLTVLRGGALSQIILSKYRQFVKIIAKNFEVFTDFGRIRAVNRNGETSFEIVGNATGQKSNLHHDSAWDYVFRLGGGNLFELSLMKDRFSFTVNPDGHATISTAASFTVNLSKPPIINIFGNSISKVSGHKEEFVNNDNQRIVGGLDTEKVNRKTYVCSGAHNEVIGGPMTVNCLRAYKQNIKGTAVTDLLSMIGYETRVAAGNYHIAIGNPMDLGTPSPLLLAQAKTGDFMVDTFSGDIMMTAMVKGNITFYTTFGSASMNTLLGTVGVSTAAGSASFGTLAGNAELSSVLGNVALSTVIGNVQVGTMVGNVNVETIGGTITLSAGASKITLGPAGVKIENAGVELLTVLQELVTTLSTTTAPGFQGPLTTAPQFGTMIPKIIAIKGV